MPIKTETTTNAWWNNILTENKNKCCLKKIKNPDNFFVKNIILIL